MILFSLSFVSSPLLFVLIPIPLPPLLLLHRLCPTSASPRAHKSPALVIYGPLNETLSISLRHLNMWSPLAGSLGRIKRYGLAGGSMSLGGML